MTVRILDMEGHEQDWDWVEENYGQVYVEREHIEGYHLVQLTEVEAIMTFNCTVLNASGGPVAGIAVKYGWPDGEDREITNGAGTAEHTAGTGEQYKPWEGQQGPIYWQVADYRSDRIVGIGWIYGTNHRHLQVTLQWHDDDDGPEPPDDELTTWQAAIMDRVDRFLHILEVVFRV